MSEHKPHRPVHRCACKVCTEHPFGQIARQHQAINRVVATFDEKSRRRFVGLLALQRGRGGIQALATITGLSRNTLRRGRAEIQRAENSASVRQSGGGRKAVEKSSLRS